jgi:hypothetical protein
MECDVPSTLYELGTFASNDIVEAMTLPGATRSGFTALSSRGPWLEYGAISPTVPPIGSYRVIPLLSVHEVFVVYAPTAITESADAGEVMTLVAEAPTVHSTRGRVESGTPSRFSTT